jgi:hypothetical protein
LSNDAFAHKGFVNKFSRWTYNKGNAFKLLFVDLLRKQGIDLPATVLLGT